jgi:hypothetical protein
MPPAAQGVAREQTNTDDGAIGSATEDTAFRDLLSELEGGKPANDAGSAGDKGTAGNGRPDALSLTPLQKLIAEAEALARPAEEKPSEESAQSADSAKQPAALPVSLLQLLAIAPASIGSVTEAPQPTAEQSAKSLLDALSNALESEKPLNSEKSSAIGLDLDGKPGPVFPVLKGEDAEELAPLPSSRPGVPAAAARAGDAVHIKMAVLGQETHLPVLATQAQGADLQARATAAIQKAYSGEADAAGAEDSPGPDDVAGAKSNADTALTARLKLTTSGEEPPPPVSRPNADIAERKSGESQAPAMANGAGAARAAEAAPSSAPTPVSQIARQIVADLATERPRAPAFASGEATERTATGPGGSVLRVLHIKLEPETLGSITVRVSLKDNVINLELSAARHETALVIEKDREALSSALKSAGYLVDGITSQTGEAPRATSQVIQAANADAQASFSSSQQSQSGLSQSGRQGGGQAPGYNEDKGFVPAPGVNENGSGGSPKPGGALYV